MEWHKAFNWGWELNWWMLRMWELKMPEKLWIASKIKRKHVKICKTNRRYLHQNLVLNLKKAKLEELCWAQTKTSGLVQIVFKIRLILSKMSFIDDKKNRRKS